MVAIGERQNEVIRPNFDRTISIDFQGATITSDTGFLLLRQVDERYRILEAVASSQPTLCRFENEILATDQGLKALEAGLSWSADTLLRGRNKKRLILDVDSTNDPVHGRQENAAYNGYYEQVHYHPLFCVTGHGDLLAAKLRPGNVPSAEGVIEMLTPLIERYRPRFKQLWLRGDAGFAAPGVYQFCEEHRVIYFIRLPINNVLKRLIAPHLQRPAGVPCENGVQVKVVELEYQADSWDKPRRVVCKLEWHPEKLFPHAGFIVTNSRLEAKHVMLVYNGRAEIENRIKEGKNTLRWDKSSCHSFAANSARLFQGALAYNLMQLLRDIAFRGAWVRPSVEWIIRRLIKVGARVVYHARKWHVHIATAFPLARPYRILLT